MPSTEEGEHRHFYRLLALDRSVGGTSSSLQRPQRKISVSVEVHASCCVHGVRLLFAHGARLTDCYASMLSRTNTGLAPRYFKQFVCEKQIDQKSNQVPASREHTCVKK
eukprot:3956514-Amphidinium_carterae.1